MGGHGGLNILPQKRWNVFNRDNRSKVEKDEREYQEALQKQKEQQIRLEAEQKREQLLSRSGYSQPTEQKKHKFINFWEEEELTQQAPQQSEDVEKQRAEKRRRGNPDQHTSDAKFDEKFQFAHGVKQSQPWYTKKPQPTPEINSSLADTHSDLTNCNNNIQDGNQLLSQLQNSNGNQTLGGVQEGGETDILGGMGIKLVTTKEIKKNEIKRKKDKKSKKGIKSTEELRKERFERERVERERANQVLQTSGRNSDIYNGKNGQGYFSGFGYGKKRQKT